MSQLKLDAHGWYLCEVVEGRMTVEESGAVAVTLAMQPTGKWNPKYANDDGTEGNYEGLHPDDEYEKAFGRWYMLKKDGSVNDEAIDQLVRSGFWLDDLRQWGEDKPPIPKVCVIQMGKPELYEGKTSIKPGWLYPAAHKPDGGIRKRADTEKLMSIDAKFGGALRASASMFKRPAANTTSP